MGRVVTTNSATLVNKGLEVIEAHLLFDVAYHHIDVVVHPQSIVHSMVEFVDGSTIAQASPPDMRLPISLGLDWPHRVGGVGTPDRLDRRRHLDVRAPRRRGVSRGAAGEEGRQGRRQLPGGLQRRERTGGRRVPRGPAAVHRHRRAHRARGRCARPRAGSSGAWSRASRSPRRSAGHGMPPTARSRRHGLRLSRGRARASAARAPASRRRAGRGGRARARSRAYARRGCRGSPGGRGPPTGSRRRRRPARPPRRSRARAASTRGSRHPVARAARLRSGSRGWSRCPRSGGGGR